MKLINKLTKLAEELLAWTFIGALMMTLVETVLYVDGIARYTDIMVWIIMAGVVYAVTQYFAGKSEPPTVQIKNDYQSITNESDK